MNAKPEYLALTLNIHKGFSASNLRYTLEALRVALRDSGCNLIFLQEVSGENSRYHQRIKGWPNTDQLEYSAVLIHSFLPPDATPLEYINEHIPPQAPLILAGDFNDWRLTAHRTLVQELD